MALLLYFTLFLGHLLESTGVIIRVYGSICILMFSFKFKCTELIIRGCSGIYVWMFSFMFFLYEASIYGCFHSCFSYMRHLYMDVFIHVFLI